MKNLITGAGVLAACLVFFSSCSSTRTIDTWRDSAYKGRYAGHVLVAGVSYPFDKRQLEDGFVARFHEYGVRAVSFQSLSPQPKLTLDSIRREAVRLKSDAILTVRLISLREKEEWDRFVPKPEVPAELYMESMVRYTPIDYELTVDDFIVESSLFDTASGKLIWKLHSETIKRGSIGKEYMMTGRFVASLSAKVLKNLRDSELIK